MTYIEFINNMNDENLSIHRKTAFSYILYIEPFTRKGALKEWAQNEINKTKWQLQLMNKEAVKRAQV